MSSMVAVEGNHFIVQSLHSSMMTTMTRKKHLGSTSNVPSSWRRLGAELRCWKGRFPWMWQPRCFPLDSDGYSHDSFLYDSTDVLLWLPHLILAHDSTHLSSSFLIYPNIHTMSQRSLLIVIQFYSLSCVASSFFPWLCYCAYWGCASWLIPDSFLTHIILHAGRIFQQRHHNCIVCLVVESALHVYKGQFSPWLGQLTIQTLLEFSYNEIRQLCFRQHTA